MPASPRLHAIRESVSRAAGQRNAIADAQSHGEQSPRMKKTTGQNLERESRRRFDPKLKAKIALEALREDTSISELATRYEVHRNQIYAWKRRIVEGAAQVFSRTAARASNLNQEVVELYATIGKLAVERSLASQKRAR